METGYLRVVVGKGLINGVETDLVLIDKSKLRTDKVVRVVWWDKKEQRCTNFIKEEDITAIIDKAEQIDNMISDLELELEVDKKGKVHYSNIASKLMGLRINVRRILKSNI